MANHLIFGISNINQNLRESFFCLDWLHENISAYVIIITLNWAGCLARNPAFSYWCCCFYGIAQKGPGRRWIDRKRKESFQKNDDWLSISCSNWRFDASSGEFNMEIIPSRQHSFFIQHCISFFAIQLSFLVSFLTIILTQETYVSRLYNPDQLFVLANSPFSPFHLD